MINTTLPEHLSPLAQLTLLDIRLLNAFGRPYPDVHPSNPRDGALDELICERLIEPRGYSVSPLRGA